MLIGNGDGSFQYPGSDDLGGWLGWSYVAVADVNGDGKLDAVVATGGVAVLLNNGGGFQPAVTYDSGGSTPDSIAAADVNGDGRPDLVVANYCVYGNCPDGGARVVGVLINTSTEDFSLAPSSSSSATVTPGQTAKYTVAVSPDGRFAQTVTLTCTGAPAQSRCSVSPSSVRLSGKSTSVSVSVSTAGNSAGMTYAGNFLPARAAVWLALSGLSGLLLLGGQKGRSRGCGRLFCALAFLCLFSVAITWPACGGSSGGGSGSSGTGTPPGTYAITVTGTFTSGSTTLTHSTKLTLIVQ